MSYPASLTPPTEPSLKVSALKARVCLCMPAWHVMCTHTLSISPHFDSTHTPLPKTQTQPTTPTKQSPTQQALNPTLLNALYFLNATLALSQPDNLPMPLPERVARVAFTSGMTVKEAVLAERPGDEEVCACGRGWGV